MKIVAELGSNFTDFQSMKNAVHLAKEAGADAIKFQYFSEHDLYGHGSIEYNFPGEWIPMLRAECDFKGIEFMCTFFNHELIEIVDPHIKTWKVASSDMCYEALLREINKTKKPVYLSTGGHTFTEIEHSLSFLNDCRTTVIYCVSDYPARHLDPADMEDFYNKFDAFGVSDHSSSVYLGGNAAYQEGADVYEKHFNPHELTTPDSPHSLSFDDFRSMVRNINGEYDAAERPKKCEKDMLLMHNRRAIATKTIKEGDTLKLWDNYGYYRSKEHDYLGSHAFKDINGMVAKKDYAIGCGVWK